ncbi:MAG: MarP family serine protease [Acidimicrobiia bacterium]
MNALDLVIIAGVAFAAVCGYRLGFVARALSWAGLAVALVVAVRLIPDLMTALASATPRGRLLAVLAFVAGLGLLGQALGLAVGALAHARLSSATVVQRGDRLAGAAVGALGAVVFLWLLLPALTSAPGWPARAAQGSTIAATIERVAPDPPPSLRELGRMVAEAPYPEVFSGSDHPSGVGTPPQLVLAPLVDAHVRSSVVRVEGQACDQIQDGTGFVVAPGIVVTNAHVVAGERTTSVFLPDGERRTARVVRFDPRRDLAVLRVENLGLAALRLGRDGGAGTVGAVYGHPGGGPLRPTPARIAEQIDARGTDIYRTTPTQRAVFVLAAELAPGDSGAPLVDQTGDVIGVAFAIDPGASTTAYALTNDELRPTLNAIPDTNAETGSCLVG